MNCEFTHSSWNLGTDSLSPMMSGVQGTQITDLDDEKKIAILDG